MKKEISLMAEGGGMRGAYVFGALIGLDLLSKKFSINDIKYFSSSSASAITIMYLLSGQLYNDGFALWRKEVTDNKFLNVKKISELFFGKEILDVDYLCDVLLKQNHPLNMSKLKKTDKLLFISVTNAITAELEFLVNSKEFRKKLIVEGDEVKVQNWLKFDIYDVLKATAAAPIVYDKSVFLGDTPYVDGGLFDPPSFDLPFIKESKKIVILTRPKSRLTHYNPMFKLAYKEYMRLNNKKKLISYEVYNKLRDKERYNYEEKEKVYSKLATEGKILLIRPFEDIKPFNNGVKYLGYLITMGISDVYQRRTEILKFLGISEK